jgi:plastocyanin
MSTITVPAGAPVLIHFTNKDSVAHNFALYQDSSYTKSIFIGTVITSSSIDYKFTAPTTPGTYFFRCAIHPSIMTGSFIVQ